MLYVVLSCSVVSDSVTPWTAAFQAPLTMEDSPGENTRVACHALLQGIFPTQESNPGLPHWEVESLPTESPGNPPLISCCTLPWFRWLLPCLALSQTETPHWPFICFLSMTGSFFLTFALRSLHYLFYLYWFSPWNFSLVLSYIRSQFRYYLLRESFTKLSYQKYPLVNTYLIIFHNLTILHHVCSSFQYQKLS